MKTRFGLALCATIFFLSGCQENDTSASLPGMWRMTYYNDGTEHNEPSEYPNYYMEITDTNSWVWYTAASENDLMSAYNGTYSIESGVITFDSNLGCGKCSIEELSTTNLEWHDASTGSCNVGFNGGAWSVTRFERQ